MYKFERYRQLGLADFDQPVGLKMNPENRWVKKAETIPWDAIEEKMRSFFRVIQVCLQNLSGQHWVPNERLMSLLCWLSSGSVLAMRYWHRSMK